MSGGRLHITNGDVAAEMLRAGKIPGEVLPWRDVLHDGPVPAGPDLEGLSAIRAGFIADCGWLDRDQALARFSSRDRTLLASGTRDEITLWFEHDLYDQLQLIQLLDWFASVEGEGRPPLTLVGPDTHLGWLTPEDLAGLDPLRRDVRPAQLTLARRAWAAFRSSDPQALEGLLTSEQPWPELPFLRDALRRHLEEFPGIDDGLSRTERQILQTIAEGPRDAASTFRACQQREQAEYLGDWSFGRQVAQLLDGDAPLLTAAAGERLWDRTLDLTDHGRQVLAGAADSVALRGIDRWLGGVRLSGRGPVWRWDRKRGGLTGPR